MRKLKRDEHIVMRCPCDGHVQIIRGPNSRQEKGWDLKNVCCRRCDVKMEVATPSVMGIADDRIMPLTAETVIGRQHVHEYEALWLEQFWRMTPIWKAICKEIDEAEPHQSVFADKEHGISHEHSNPGIKITHVYVHAAVADKPPYSVRFCYKINYHDTDELARREHYSRTETLDVPVELVTNFSPIRFEDFCSSRRGFLAERKRDYHKRCILEFFEEHDDLTPEDVAFLLEEAKTDAEEIEFD